MDIQAMILSFLQSQPLFASVIAIMGAIRLFAKPIFTVARMVAARVPVPEDEAAQEAAIQSKGWYKVLAFLVDLLFSVKLPGQK